VVNNYYINIKYMFRLTSLWNDINKINSETKNICEKVIEELENQTEIIINTDKKLNQSKQVIDNSNKILKSMTWYGWFINLIPFNSFFSNIIDIKRKKENVLFIENNHNTDIIHDNNSKKYDFESIRNIDIDIEDSNDYEDSEQLKQLEYDLMNLKWVGEKIGSYLDSHNNYIDKIYDKTQIISSETHRCNKKTDDFL